MAVPGPNPPVARSSTFLENCARFKRRGVPNNRKRVPCMYIMYVVQHRVGRFMNRGARFKILFLEFGKKTARLRSYGNQLKKATVCSILRGNGRK